MEIPISNFLHLLCMGRIMSVCVVFIALVPCISAPRKPMQCPVAPAVDFIRFEKYRTLLNGPRLSLVDAASTAIDFGGIFNRKPAAALRPASAEEIAMFVTALYMSVPYDELTVAAKGAGHSIYGQAQAPGGAVVDMRSLRGILIHEHDRYAEVAAGELWVDVLIESLKYGLAPRSWTDYLYLTVGGILSNAGISGQTFRHGPQISNVLEFDIVTGTGDLKTCSTTENKDLFYAAMGGLGQFGIITKARIILETAPLRVRWVRIFYNDFEQFTTDQELLVSMQDAADSVDYLEGFMVPKNEALRSWFIGFPTSNENLSIFPEIGNEVYFCIEIGKYVVQDGDAHMDDVMRAIMSRLRFIPSLIYSAEVSYLDFLNRVRTEEWNLRSRGLWDVPHPWLNLFVPRSNIHDFPSNLLRIVPRHTINGPILIYPVVRSKWNSNMSTVLPKDDDKIFYVVGILRSADPQCSVGSSCMENLLSQNQKIVDISTTIKANTESERYISNDRGVTMGAKQYLPYYSHEWQWKNHFGSKWGRFLQRKARYDPLNILAPGQRILKRKAQSNTLLRYRDTSQE